MSTSIAYNMDCLAAMREMPDNAFDLAVVDPPYGDGLHAENGGGKGWFTKYNQAVNSQSVHVEREREGGTRGTDSADDSISTRRPTIDRVHTKPIHHAFGLRKNAPNYEERKREGQQTRKKS